MKLTINDVGHGQCISLIHDNGNVMLWDCGHEDSHRPSVFLPQFGIRRVDRLFVTNYDEDHLSDLPAVRSSLSIREMVRNKSWTAEALEQEKKKHGPLSEAMKSMLDMIRTYTGGPVTPAPEFPRVRYRVFSNNRGDGFDDTNNCSLVTFLSVDSLKLIIPGDIEKPGLEALLKKEEFRSELSDVSVFIAPHHGRDSGYHPDVFKYCTPDFVIISDSEVKYATQEMTNTYGSKARGIQFNGETRSVLSTRKDGSLQWDL